MPQEELSAHVIGLRLDPEAAPAEWYTLWFEDSAGMNRLVTCDGRLVWTSTAVAARASLTAYAGIPLSVEAAAPVVCDVALLLHAVAENEAGSEADVLDTLNLLDDALFSIEFRDVPGGETLDRLVRDVTEGRSLSDAVTAVGGTDVVIEPILGSLGRVLALSTFRPEASA